MKVSQSPGSSKIGPPEEGPTRYITLAISNINLPPAYPLSSDRHNLSYSFNDVISSNFACLRLSRVLPDDHLEEYSIL